ncbi:MAG: hypothetical protein ABI678_11015 [Kofleriaceae bacterium]
MRRAFAACVAFAILVVVVAVRFGFKDSAHEVPTQPIVDAAIADAPLDAPPVPLDAAPAPKKQPPRPTARPAPKPRPKPTPEIATPVLPKPVFPPPPGRACTQPPNPQGCPTTEPNVNRPCDADGVHCVYAGGCCPIVYVCHDGAFEAWFTRCP